MKITGTERFILREMNRKCEIKNKKIVESLQKLKLAKEGKITTKGRIYLATGKLK